MGGTTHTSRQQEYIFAKLNCSRFSELLSRDCSVIVFGSSIDERADQFSDWDFKLLAEAAILTDFLSRWPDAATIEDKIHVPESFCALRSYQALERDLTIEPAVNLWIYSRAVVFRDDGNAYKNVLGRSYALFEASLPTLVQQHYIALRSLRHAIDNAAKRPDTRSLQLVKTDFLIKALQLLHLLKSRPYPNVPWIHWSFLKEYGCEPIFLSAVEEVFTADSQQLPLATRSLVDIISRSLIDLGADRELILHWWKCI